MNILDKSPIWLKNIFLRLLKGLLCSKLNLIKQIKKRILLKIGKKGY